MGQGYKVALCCLCGMSGMQLLYCDFCLFLKKRMWWERQTAAEGEHCAEASSVTPGLHLAPDPWLLLQGWRHLCPLKPRGEWGAGGGASGESWPWGLAMPWSHHMLAWEKRLPASFPSQSQS